MRRLVAVAALVLAACASQPGTPVAAPTRPPRPAPELSAQELPGTEAPAPVPSPAPATEAPDGAKVTPEDPVRLTIPAIAVDTSLIELGLNADETMEVPEDFDLAGWYVYGPRPGEVGPAVIAGHVDSTSGPAVFSRLRELTVGDRVEVARGDGTVATFTVDRVERHAKDAFPTDDVYGNTDGPELRLITCGGQFDRATGHYKDNVIVYASRAQ